MSVVEAAKDTVFKQDFIKQQQTTETGFETAVFVALHNSFKHIQITKGFSYDDHFSFSFSWLWTNHLYHDLVIVSKITKCCDILTVVIGLAT